MPTANDYGISKFFSGKGRPKVPGLATPRFNPSNLMSGQSAESLGDPGFMIQGGLAGLNSQPIQSPFASTFLYKRKR